jgi:cytochrome P450
MTLRKAIRHTQISDHPIPAGTYVAIVPWAINRSVCLWGPTAGEFIPERWIDQVDERKCPNALGGVSSRYAHSSFLHGPKGCIGRSFALAEIRIVISTLVRDLVFELDGEIVPEPEGLVTIKPKNGLHVRLKLVT